MIFANASSQGQRATPETEERGKPATQESPKLACCLQDDAVERAIAQLEMTVQACRGAQNKLVPSPHSQKLSSAAIHLANELIREDRGKPSTPEHRSPTEDRGRTSSPAPDQRSPTEDKGKPSTPVGQRSYKDLPDSHIDVVSETPTATAPTLASESPSVCSFAMAPDLDVTDSDDEAALLAKALSLRTELRRADARLQAAIAEDSAVKLTLRESDERHRRRIDEMKEKIAKLRRDNSRLERSAQQSALEEQRLADQARSQPVRTDERIQRLVAECHRLEKENRHLGLESAAIKEELSSVRGVVAQDSRRHGPQPRQIEPYLKTGRRIHPWT